MCKVNPVVDCQRDVIGNQGQKIDLAPGEGISGLSRKPKNSQSAERRIEWKHTERLVTAFTKEPNHFMEPGFLVERRNDERLTFRRGNLTDFIFPGFHQILWSEDKPIAVNYIA